MRFFLALQNVTVSFATTKIEPLYRLSQRLFIRILFNFFVILFTQQLTAQTKGLGTWNNFSARFVLNKKWDALLEGQLRSQKVVYDFSNYEYRASLLYHFRNEVSVLGGMGRFVSFQPDGNFKDPIINDEFRIWEQFIMNNHIGMVRLEHRYRIEQRFTSLLGYRNRFRYRLNAIIPFQHKVVENKSFYASIFNELMVTNEGPYFEQNLIFAGIGYQFNRHFSFLGGYLNRFVNVNASNQFGKNFFQTNFLFTIDAYRNGNKRNHGSVE